MTLVRRDAGMCECRLTIQLTGGGPSVARELPTGVVGLPFGAAPGWATFPPLDRISHNNPTANRTNDDGSGTSEITPWTSPPEPDGKPEVPAMRSKPPPDSSSATCSDGSVKAPQ
jgi:hypothetical protein